VSHVGTHLGKCGQQPPAITNAGDPEFNQVFIGEISKNSIVDAFPKEIFKEVLAPFCLENGFKL